MGSDSDLPTMQDAIDVLVEFGVAYEARIVSAHRTPEVMVEYARAAAGRGLRVIIAGAGGAAHLPGMTASLTPLPVIGVPVPQSKLDGLDSLLSIVQMPAGVPVATVGIGNARNAGLLAVRILGASDDKLRERDGPLPGRCRAAGAREGRARLRDLVASHSLEIARSTSSLAARRAGRMAAPTLATARITTTTMSVAGAMANVEKPLSRSALTTLHPKNSPIAKPLIVPSNEMMTDSHRTVERTCDRDMPTARKQSDLARPLGDRQSERVGDADQRDEQREEQQHVDQRHDLIDALLHGRP